MFGQVSGTKDQNLEQRLEFLEKAFDNAVERINELEDQVKKLKDVDHDSRSKYSGKDG